MAINFFNKIKESLTKTRNELVGSLESILPFGADINEELLEEVEEILFEADLGIHAADMVVSELRMNAAGIKRKKIDPYSVMKKTIIDMICGDGVSNRISIGGDRPYVFFVVGVNGTGKTTTIGKLALRFKNEGYSVLLAACDTFRAAAVEQLGIWAERSGAEFIRAPVGADAASVAYDAMMRAQARSTDVVLIDTAGRLHTSRNLMEELKKYAMSLTEPLKLPRRKHFSCWMQQPVRILLRRLRHSTVKSTLPGLLSPSSTVRQKAA